MSDFDFGSEISDLYESDKAVLKDIKLAVESRYREAKLLTPVEDMARRAQCARELIERVNEAGFACDVLWEWESEERHPEDPDIPLHQSPDTTDDPGDMSLIYTPKLIITGRTAKLLDYDHDKQKFEVREGVFDGVKGVIDPNTGLLREDSKKKDIY